MVKRKKWQPKDMLDKKFVSDMDKFVDQIFDRAWELDWTWTQLAREAGCAYSTVSRLGYPENRSYLGRTRTLYRLAKAVGLEVKLAQVLRKHGKRAA